MRLIPLAHRQYIDQEIEKLLTVGSIANENLDECPYFTKTLLVPKKNVTRNMCLNYKDINAQTLKKAFSLPRIDYVWLIRSKATYFASLDLIMGYHQVKVEAADRNKIAFLTHKSLFV